MREWLQENGRGMSGVPEIVNVDTRSNGRVDWDVIQKARPNVLLEGPFGATELAIRRLTPYLLEPVVRTNPAGALGLGTRPRTLILQDVDDLRAEAQAALCGWLEAQERVHVLSTSRNALFALVTRGLFDETLYYRLNQMLLKIQSEDCYGPRAPWASPPEWNQVDF
jgi:Sigma-54 interaction domain